MGTAIAGVYFGSKTAMAIGRDLRRGVFRKVTSFSAKDVNTFGAPTLITRGTNDVQQVQMLVLMGLNFMVATPIMCIGGIIMALREDLNLSWLVWVSVPVLIVVVGYLVVRLMPLFRSMQKKIDRINGVLREQIIGIRVVRAFVREPYETERFGEANKELTDVSLKIGAPVRPDVPGHRHDPAPVHRRRAVVRRPARGLRRDAGGRPDGLPAVPAADPDGRHDGHLHGHDDSARLRLRGPHRRGARRRTLHPRPRTARRRPPPSPACVEFRNVTFAYPGAESPVLSNISFTAEPGETMAIIGSTGAGKTTLLSLLPRLYDVAEGEVLLDGVSVTNLDRAEITKRVALVPQRPYLFSGTIEHNLRFGKTEATDQELWDALRGGPGRGLRPREEERPELPHLPGRHQRLRRPAATALHRPGPGHQAQGVPL